MSTQEAFVYVTAIVAATTVIHSILEALYKRYPPKE